MIEIDQKLSKTYQYDAYLLESNTSEEFFVQAQAKQTGDDPLVYNRRLYVSQADDGAIDYVVRGRDGMLKKGRVTLAELSLSKSGFKLDTSKKLNFILPKLLEHAQRQGLISQLDSDNPDYAYSLPEIEKILYQARVFGAPDVALCTDNNVKGVISEKITLLYRSIGPHYARTPDHLNQNLGSDARQILSSSRENRLTVGQSLHVSQNHFIPVIWDTDGNILVINTTPGNPGPYDNFIKAAISAISTEMGAKGIIPNVLPPIEVAQNDGYSCGRLNALALASIDQSKSLDKQRNVIESKLKNAVKNDATKAELHQAQRKAWLTAEAHLDLFSLDSDSLVIKDLSKQKNSYQPTPEEQDAYNNALNITNEFRDSSAGKLHSPLSMSQEQQQVQRGGIRVIRRGAGGNPNNQPAPPQPPQEQPQVQGGQIRVIRRGAGDNPNNQPVPFPVSIPVDQALEVRPQQIVRAKSIEERKQVFDKWLKAHPTYESSSWSKQHEKNIRLPNKQDHFTYSATDNSAKVNIKATKNKAAAFEAMIDAVLSQDPLRCDINICPGPGAVLSAEDAATFFTVAINKGLLPHLGKLESGKHKGQPLKEEDILKKLDPAERKNYWTLVKKRASSQPNQLGFDQGRHKNGMVLGNNANFYCPDPLKQPPNPGNNPSNSNGHNLPLSKVR